MSAKTWHWQLKDAWKCSEKPEAMSFLAECFPYVGGDFKATVEEMTFLKSVGDRSGYYADTNIVGVETVVIDPRCRFAVYHRVVRFADSKDATLYKLLFT